MPRKKTDLTTQQASVAPVAGGTVIAFVLDETGSMDVVRDATISGFNEYVDSLKRNGQNVTMSLVKFNSRKKEIVYVDKPLMEVPALSRSNYVPDAMTPLYDAIAHTIRALEAALPSKQLKPSVLCVIMTDGQENASHEYTREKIFALISEKEAEGWTFAYLGANQDAWEVGASIGVPVGSSMSYASGQPKAAFAALSDATSAYRASGSRQTRSLFGGAKSVADYSKRKMKR